jgi:hypothetical protein
MAGYYTITDADNGKVLAFPLNQSSGGSNDFTGATAVLRLRDQRGNALTRALSWNGTTVQWEYPVVAGEFAAGRWHTMVAVTFLGGVGPIYSTEAVFDVIRAEGEVQ